MKEVAFRVRRAWSRPVPRWFWVALATLPCLLVVVPLAGVPGYDLSEALALVHGLLGPWLGVTFGRQERALGGRPRLVRATWAVTAGFLALVAALVPPLLVSGLHALLATPCSPISGLELFPVLTLPSALIASAFGVLVGLSTDRWWSAALAWFGGVLASAVHTAWPILFGPQVFAFNHLAGWLPGPIYDELIRLPWALIWFRLGTVAQAAVLVSLAALRLPLSGPSPWRLFEGALGLWLSLELLGPTLGFRQTDDALAARLGGRAESEHVVLHYPKGTRGLEVDRALRDAEFRATQLAAFMGGAPEGKVTVWWYGNAEEKQALVGARHTQFAKPWRREVHVNGFSFPHPVLKHELVHAFLGPWGRQPFGVAARLFGLSPHVGVIEGIAVAADNPADDLTLMEWAAAMKQQRLLPDVRTLLEPEGFYAAPHTRAYATAGAFLRWLAETRGKEALRRLYRDGDFEAAYHVPLAELAKGFEASLDQVPLDEQAVNEAFARFRGGSIFERPCAREVARLRDDADRHPDLAVARLRRCREIQPQEPGHVLALADALRATAPDEARMLLEALAAEHDGEPATWGEAALALVSLPKFQGDEGATRALLQRMIDRHVSPAVDRTARVRLAILDLEPDARAAASDYFKAWNSTDDQTGAMRAYLEKTSSAPFDSTRAERGEEGAVIAYLYGRRRLQSGHPRDALLMLDRAQGHLGAPSLEKEARRLRLEAAFLSGRCDAVRAVAEEARATESAAFAARARDWVDRCAFEERTYGGPLATP